MWKNRKRSTKPSKSSCTKILSQYFFFLCGCYSDWSINWHFYKVLSDQKNAFNFYYALVSFLGVVEAAMPMRKHRLKLFHRNKSRLCKRQQHLVQQDTKWKGAKNDRIMYGQIPFFGQISDSDIEQQVFGSTLCSNHFGGLLGLNRYFKHLLLVHFAWYVVITPFNSAGDGENKTNGVDREKKGRRRLNRKWGEKLT